MHHVRQLIFTLFTLSLGLFLVGCGHQSKPQPATKLAFVQSGQHNQPRIWFQFQQDSASVTAHTTITSIYLLRNGRVTTYMMPTGHQKITLALVDRLSTGKLIETARNKDKQAYKQGVKTQRATLADSIAGLKTDLKSLRQSKSNSTQIKTLERYLKVNQSIYDNPQSYSAPKSYQLTGTLSSNGEQFGLKLFPVKTVQYGDANVIMANATPFTNLTYSKRLQPKQFGQHHYAGYQADITGYHYQLLTRVSANTKIIYDTAETTGVSK